MEKKDRQSGNREKARGRETPRFTVTLAAPQPGPEADESLRRLAETAAQLIRRRLQ